MNWLNKLLLKIFLFPKEFYSKLGCNNKHLEAIVTLKLLMDDRRPSSFSQMRKQQKQKKEISNATLWGMIGSLMIGLFYLMAFAVSDSYVTNLTLFFTFYITILSLTLITDFTTVLLDVRDNFIILPKPVSDRTFVLSRLIHIMIHISKMIVPLTIPTLVFVGIDKGILGTLILLPLILLATLFTVFIINAFYLIILKITTPEKFKNIISYIQIAFAISIYGASQVLPRMIGKSMGHFDINNYKWTKFAPTFWFANSWNSLYSLTFNTTSFICLFLSIVIPIVSIWVVVKYFAPSFNQKLSMISAGNSETNIPQLASEKNARKKYSEWWANLITKKGTERMGFIFTWKMMLRSRDFKMKVYPGIGYMIVILVVMYLQNSDNTMEQLKNNLVAQNSKGKLAVLLIIYFSSLMITTALGGIVMSDKYKAAWIYFITPISKPGAIIAGAVKAVTIMFFIPLALLALVFGVSIIGYSVLPNLLLAICNQLFIITLMSIASVNYLPFSTSVYKPNFSSILKNIAMMIMGFIVGAIHYAIYSYTWLVIILIVVSVTATYFLFNTINKYSWRKITSVYSE